MLFGFLFAVNSSLHSYLILAYAGSEKAAEDVGFYYAANAGGRLAGILLSGALYQVGGMAACLFGSAVMLGILLAHRIHAAHRAECPPSNDCLNAKRCRRTGHLSISALDGVACSRDNRFVGA